MLRLSFHRFFGLPRLRTSCGRLSLAMFARRLSLHSVQVSIPLSSSDIGPFNYILNSAQLFKLVTADFVSKRFPMYRPYYLHLCGSEKLLGIGCSCFCF
jgi:hypothetical protein